MEIKRKNFWRTVFAFGFFVSTLVYLFFPVFLGKIPFPGDVLIGHYHPWFDNVWEGRAAGFPIKNFVVDPLFQSYPWRKLSLERIFSGNFPLWNPYNILGMPLLGVSLSAPFYPLNLSFLAGTNFGWSFLVIITPFIAALGVFLWLRNLKIGFWASLLASFAWAFSGLIIDKIENVVDAHSFIWLPFALLAIDKLREKKEKKWFLLLCFSIIFNWLSGYPPQFLQADLILFCWAVLRLFREKKVFLNFLVIFILAHLVLTFFWLPVAELSLHARGGSAFMEGEPYFLPWINLVLLIAPRFFGAASSLNSWLPSAYLGEKLWIGLVALTFSLIGTLSFKKDKLVRFWLIMVFLSAMLFLPTPISRAVKALNLPFVSSITPMKLAWIFNLGLIFLAAKGVELWTSEGRKKIRGIIIVIFILGLVVTGLWVLGWYYPSFLAVEMPQIVSSVSRTRSIAFRNLLLPTAFFGLTSIIIIAGLFLKDKWKKIGSFVLIILCLGELSKEASYYLNFIPEKLIYPETKIIKFLKENSLGWRVMVTDPQILPVNTNIVYKIPMINGYSSLYPFRSGQLIKLNKFEVENGLTGYNRTVYQADIKSPLLNLLGVKYFLSLKPLEEKGFRLLFKEGETYLYESSLALPKAWFAKKWQQAESDLAVAKSLLSVDRKKEVILEEGILLPANLSVKDSTVVINLYQENNVNISTKNPADGLLLVNDAYYPGWKAYIDGQETKIYRADFNLRAIIVPKGEHEIKFIYAPKSFFIGGVVSLVSFVLFLTYFFCLKKDKGLEG